MNELVRREFVRPIRVSSMEGEDEFSFWHALVRDVAYQQIPRSPRADKHVAAAAWIAEGAEERLADYAEILVHHYEQALELARAAGDDASQLEPRSGGFLLLAGDRLGISTPSVRRRTSGAPSRSSGTAREPELACSQSLPRSSYGVVTCWPGSTRTSTRSPCSVSRIRVRQRSR